IIRDHAERHRVAAAEQAGTRQVAAARICGRADAIAEEAAEVIARSGPRRLDVDTRQHGPAPLVVGIAALTRARLRTGRAADRPGHGIVASIVSGVDLVEDRRHGKAAPGL